MNNITIFFALLSSILLITVLPVSSVPANASPSAQNETEEQTSLAYRIEKPFFGDLNEIRDRHIIRVLVSFSRTGFFQTHKGFRGHEYDLLKAYEAYLNRGPRQKRYQTQLAFIPVSFDKTLTMLEQGYGDIAASGLSITPERKLFVDFTAPYIKNIDEVLVANFDAPFIERLEDFAGKQIIVVSNSSHIVHLETINQTLGLLGLEGIEIVKADPLFESEDLLNLVNQGIYDYTVTDSHIAEIWEEVMNNIFIHDEIKIFHNGKIGWATQKNKPQLLNSLNGFIRNHARPGKKLGNVIFQKYFQDTYWVKRPLTNSLLARKQGLKEKFQSVSSYYDFDWHLIAAQAYQESRFDHSKVSSAGAQGIMQVKPTTAKDKHVNIPNIDKVEDNIHAGVKYLSFLKSRYFSKDGYSPEDRVNFALAAYNAGPRKVLRMQRSARKKGLNPYKWFRNVEIIARQEIGHETVNYVTGIQKMRRFLATSEKIALQKMLKLDQITQDSEQDAEETPKTAQHSQHNPLSLVGPVDFDVSKPLIN